MYYRKFLIWQKLDDWGCSTSSFYEVIVSNHSMALPYRVILWVHSMGLPYGVILWCHSMGSICWVNLWGHSMGVMFDISLWSSWIVGMSFCRALHNFVIISITSVRKVRSEKQTHWQSIPTIFTALYCIEGKVSCPLCVFTPFIQMICGWILNRKQRK